MIFYVGTHMVNHAANLENCMISINRLSGRKSDFAANNWIMDSGAFTRITTHGEHHDLHWYAEQINRWARCGNMQAAVSQDYMCEPFVLGITGMSVKEHQALTIERYARLKRATQHYIMPVLQGYKPSEYVAHIEQYSSLLNHSAWVGVGSVCKRNANAISVYRVLSEIKKKRWDLRLHGFGLKITALSDSRVKDLLFSADSMAWSYSARKKGRNASSIHEAKRFVEEVESMSYQRYVVL